MKALHRVCAVLAMGVQISTSTSGQELEGGAPEALQSNSRGTETRRELIRNLHSIPKFDMSAHGGWDSKEGMYYVLSVGEYTYKKKDIERLFSRKADLQEIIKSPGYAEGDLDVIVEFLKALKEEGKPFQTYLSYLEAELLRQVAEDAGDGGPIVRYYRLAELSGGKSRGHELLINSLNDERLWRAHLELMENLMQFSPEQLKDHLNLEAEMPTNSGTTPTILMGTYDPQEVLKSARFYGEAWLFSLEFLAKLESSPGLGAEVKVEVDRCVAALGSKYIVRSFMDLLFIMLKNAQSSSLIKEKGEESTQVFSGFALEYLHEVKTITDQAQTNLQVLLSSASSNEIHNEEALMSLNIFRLGVELTSLAGVRDDVTTSEEGSSESVDLNTLFDALFESALGPWFKEGAAIFERCVEEEAISELSRAKLDDWWDVGPGGEFDAWRGKFRNLISPGLLADLDRVTSAPIRPDDEFLLACFKLLVPLLLDEHWDETRTFFEGFGDALPDGSGVSVDLLLDWFIKVRKFSPDTLFDEDSASEVEQMAAVFSQLDATITGPEFENQPLANFLTPIVQMVLMHVLSRTELKEAAIQQAESLVSKHPDFLAGWLILANLRAITNDVNMNGAILALGKARELDPFASSTYSTEGLIYSMKGDWWRALDAYRVAGDRPYIHHAHAEVCAELLAGELSTSERGGLLFESKKEYLRAFELYSHWIQESEEKAWDQSVRDYQRNCLLNFTSSWEELGDGLDVRLFKMRALEKIVHGPYADEYENFYLSQYRSLALEMQGTQGPVGARIQRAYANVLVSYVTAQIKKGPSTDRSEVVQRESAAIRNRLLESRDILTALFGSLYEDIDSDLHGPFQSDRAVFEDPILLEVAMDLLYVHHFLREEAPAEQLFAVIKELQERLVGYSVENHVTYFHHIGQLVRGPRKHPELSSTYFKEAFLLSLEAFGETHRFTMASAMETVVTLRRAVTLGQVDVEVLDAFIQEIPEEVLDWLRGRGVIEEARAEEDG